LALTKGTSHFANAGSPVDRALAAEYDEGPYAGLEDLILKGIASLEPADADVGKVAEAIVKVVETPFDKRPFRVHVDPSQDGCEIVNGVADRIRAELLRNIGLQDLLTPRDLVAESQSAAQSVSEPKGSTDSESSRVIKAMIRTSQV
jgi:hypothetical protein